MNKLNVATVAFLFLAWPFIVACGDSPFTNPTLDGDLEETDQTTDGESPLADGDQDTATDNPVDNPVDNSADNLTDEAIDNLTDQADPFTGDYTDIVLSCNSIAVTGPGATVSGAIVTITAAGAYRITGTLCDGQVRVDTTDTAPVQITLAGASITCLSSAAFYVVAAEDVVIFLADGTQNVMTDGSSYFYDVAGEDEPNAALFSKGDLTISGNGALTVNGNFNDGIASKDSLRITGGVFVVNAWDDGLRGKDDITVEGGTFTITASGDGMSSDNTEDAARGYIAIANGSFTITAQGDGIVAQTIVNISGGNFFISTGGGSARTLTGTASAKGIKGTGSVYISGGTFVIDGADDGVHSNGNITITGGTFTIAVTEGIGSGDQNQGGQDGMHSDATLQIDGGDITVTKSYEGLEALYIIINNGTIHVTSSDDGFNCAGGDGSGGWNPGGGSTINYLLYIGGGYIWMNASGDGLDSNGNIEIAGGLTLVNGPTADNNGAIDHGDGRDNYIKMTGGFLVAAGSSGMAEAPDTTSSQNSVLVYLTASQQAGKIFRIQKSSGEALVTFAPMKAYKSVVFSSPAFATGQYSIFLGGSSTGVNTDGLYEGGSYSGGTQYTTFSVSSVNTKVGSGGHP